MDKVINIHVHAHFMSDMSIGGTGDLHSLFYSSMGAISSIDFLPVTLSFTIQATEKMLTHAAAAGRAPPHTHTHAIHYAKR